MRPALILALLPVLAYSIPLPLPAGSNTALTSAISKDISDQKTELSDVQNTASAEANHAPAAQVQSDISGVKGAINTAVDDRQTAQSVAAGGKGKRGQKRAAAETAVQQGLDKVQAAQGKAVAAANTLNGGSGDAKTLTNLASTVKTGIATNEQNLSLAEKGGK